MGNRRCYSGPAYPRRRNEADGASGARRGRRGTSREPLARHHCGRHGRRLCRHRVRKRSDASRRRGDLRRRCRRMDPSGHAGAVERLLRARDIGRIPVPAGQRAEAGHLVVPRDGNHVLLGDHRLVLHLAPKDRDAGLGHVPRSVGDPGPDPERAPNRVEYVHSHLQQPDDGRGARRDRARRQSEAPVLPPRDASPGITFLSIQAFEYQHLYFGEGLTFTHAPLGSGVNPLYGPAFYAQTGVHGSHVTAGVLALAYVTRKAFKGGFTKENHEAIELVGLYWHFVDVVWIFLFTIVYLV